MVSSEWRRCGTEPAPARAEAAIPRHGVLKDGESVFEEPWKTNAAPVPAPRRPKAPCRASPRATSDARSAARARRRRPSSRNVRGLRGGAATRRARRARQRRATASRVNNRAAGGVLICRSPSAGAPPPRSFAFKRREIAPAAPRTARLKNVLRSANKLRMNVRASISRWLPLSTNDTRRASVRRQFVVQRPIAARPMRCKDGSDRPRSGGQPRRRPARHRAALSCAAHERGSSSAAPCGRFTRTRSTRPATRPRCPLAARTAAPSQKPISPRCAGHRTKRPAAERLAASPARTCRPQTSRSMSDVRVQIRKTGESLPPVAAVRPAPRPAVAAARCTGRASRLCAAGQIVCDRIGRWKTADATHAAGGDVDQHPASLPAR